MYQTENKMSKDMHLFSVPSRVHFPAEAVSPELFFYENNTLFLSVKMLHCLVFTINNNN